jgi:hypothetical protein
MPILAPVAAALQPKQRETLMREEEPFCFNPDLSTETSGSGDGEEMDGEIARMVAIRIRILGPKSISTRAENFWCNKAFIDSIHAICNPEHHTDSQQWGFRD